MNYEMYMGAIRVDWDVRVRALLVSWGPGAPLIYGKSSGKDYDQPWDYCVIHPVLRQSHDGISTHTQSRTMACSSFVIDPILLRDWVSAEVRTQKSLECLVLSRSSAGTQPGSAA